MRSSLIRVHDVSLSFGHEVLFSGASFCIYEKDRLALVGRNGAGKSTLLKMILGHVDPDGGQVSVSNRVRLAHLSQGEDVSDYQTLKDYLVAGLDSLEQSQYYVYEDVLKDMGLSSHDNPNHLSGGLLRRVSFLRCLIQQPDLMLLDEPTNHLDMSSIEWLEERLDEYSGAVLVISHDRRFLNRVTKSVLWIDHLAVRRLDKNFSEFEAWSLEFLQEKEQERLRLDRKIDSETRWSREGISARRKRNMGRMRALEALKKKRQDAFVAPKKEALHVSCAQNSGQEVVVMTNVTQNWDGRAVMKNVNLRIMRGQKIGIVGSNGSGKTTFLKVLMGQLKPDEGQVKRGTHLEMMYLDQLHDMGDLDQSVGDFLAPGGGDQIMVRGHGVHVRSYLKEFLFSVSQVNSPLHSLSGGERQRLILAKHLAQPTNFMIFDEPTNDLDMETLDLLEEMMSQYEGTLMVVSHDRDFLDRCVHAILAVDDQGNWQMYAGNYSDYVHQLSLQKSEDQRKNKHLQGVKKKLLDQVKKKSSSKIKIKTKLSYQEERQWNLLPEKIQKLEEQLQNLHRQLSDTTLFQRDPQTFDEYTHQFQQVQIELDESETRWLELDLLKSSFENSPLK